jgi:2-polyprenyl-6-methoxyphenol hydroxylase-like FAD-dependent oxidoreductase
VQLRTPELPYERHHAACWWARASVKGRYSSLTRSERAVVLGASMSGLLAARVLADFYSSVTVVDRDVLPQEPRNRRGVPQGAHIHILQARGSHALEELFPGLRDELVADGAPIWDDGDLASFHVSAAGHVLAQRGRLRYPKDSVQYFAIRPLLESHVRRRLRAYPNVAIRDGHDVVGLTFNNARGGVTGVRLAKRGTADETTLPAELVVDATGRGSRTPTFLADLGYGRPREDELVVHLAYATQRLHIPSGSLSENFFVVNPKPGRPTGFGLQVCENNLWMLTLISMVGHELPIERCGMLTFLEHHAPAKAVAAVRAAEPLGEMTHYHVPSSRWRRYDKMRRTPAGLLVIGDAICSFNPIYAQGMTVAALEATVLRECLRRGQRDLPRRFFRASAKPIGAAWQTAVGSDLALPEVDAPRPLRVRLSNAFMERVLNAAETDALMADHFLRVVGMIDAPTRLLHPDVLFRIAKSVYAPRATGGYEGAQDSLAGW